MARYKQTDAFPEVGGQLAKACDEYSAMKDELEDCKKRLELRQQELIVALRATDKVKVKHAGKVYSIKTTEAKTKVSVKDILKK